MFDLVGGAYVLRFPVFQWFYVFELSDAQDSSRFHRRKIPFLLWIPCEKLILFIFQISKKYQDSSTVELCFFMNTMWEANRIKTQTKNDLQNNYEQSSFLYTR